VQQVVEDAARHVVREDIKLLGASRTDSGVHARGQVGAFSTANEIAPLNLLMAINSRLPRDVRIAHVETVEESFNPISDCTSKGYRYSIKHGCTDAVIAPLFDRHYLYWTPIVLNVPAMHAAAQHIIGEHDFASFTRLHHGRESTVRTVLSCSVTATDEHHCHIDISGTGFLYNMVRIIAGTLVYVGAHRFEVDEFHAIIEARVRTAAGPTLPPEGLCLQWIRYGERDAPGADGSHPD
jgi:tRNA pseudouridine38-40 synthase